MYQDESKLRKKLNLNNRIIRKEKFNSNKTDKELLEFRHGAVVIAKKTNAKILPFAIKGEYKLIRKGVQIQFGNPIDISQMQLEDANEYLKNEVLNLLTK